VGSSSDVVTLTLESDGLPLGIVGAAAAIVVVLFLSGVIVVRRVRMGGHRRRPGQKSF